MGWTEELPNGKYRGVWRDAGGKRRSKSGFTQRSLANRYANEQEAKARRGRATGGKLPMWGDFVDGWLDRRTMEPSTERALRGRIENHVRPRWGTTRLDRITRPDVERWVKDLNETSLSPTTVVMVFRAFSVSMKQAVKDGLLDASPCTLIELPQRAPNKEHALTRTEVDLAVHHMDPPYSTAALLLVGTGMRFGEMAGLHWQHVDLENNLIHVQYTWDAVGKRIKAYPKSKKPRSVPIPDFVIAELMKLDPGKGHCGHPHAKGAPCSSRLVLTSREGHPLSFSTMAENHWRPALKRAGLAAARLHDLRHSYATWLRQGGTDLEEVQKLLGHGSVLVTQRYSHIGASHHDRVLRVLNETESGSRTT